MPGSRYGMGLRAAGVAAWVGLSLGFGAGCFGIDDRNPIAADAGARPAAGAGSTQPGVSGGSQLPGSGAGNTAGSAGASASSEGPGLGSTAPGAAPGSSCSNDGQCRAGLRCGASATPESGTGRVCCDSPCDTACQGCSAGPGGGTCGPLAPGSSCTSPGQNLGACSADGQCNDYCTLGISRLGACSLAPG